MTAYPRLSTMPQEKKRSPFRGLSPCAHSRLAALGPALGAAARGRRAVAGYGLWTTEITVPHQSSYTTPGDASYEKLRLLAVTGGIPRYLEEINPSLPADTNIQRMCFSREGLLFNEFDSIFTDLFSRRNRTYRRIVTSLVDGPLDLDGIYRALGSAKTGKISAYAEDLVQTGLIARDHTWSLKTGGESKLSRLRLSDNYLRFYLKFIEPNRRRIERRTLSRLPNIDSILGLQFENLVLKNRHCVFQSLGIDPNDVIYDNPYFQRKTQRQRGCQIDYLIQTRDRILYVCEIKFSKNAAPASVVAEMTQKIGRLSIPRNMSYRPVLIYAGALSPALEESTYFTTKIDLGEFLR